VTDIIQSRNAVRESMGSVWQQRVQ